jgi:transcriptional regulator with XRE-family HTH domain
LSPVHHTSETSINFTLSKSSLITGLPAACPPVDRVGRFFKKVGVGPVGKTKYKLTAKASNYLDALTFMEYLNAVKSFLIKGVIMLSMKRPTTIKGFGQRLAEMRRASGLTQVQLGEKVGVSNRVIHYYDGETNYPPAHLIEPLAKALNVSVEELLGVKAIKQQCDPQHATLWRRRLITSSHETRISETSSIFTASGSSTSRGLSRG